MNKFFLRVPLQEKILFAKHLAIMIKAGMSILDGLEMLKKQARSKSMLKILDQLVSDVSNGQFLSTSLEQFRNVFGDFTINVIRVGETSGILYENLNYLSEELSKKQALRRKVIGSLIYPIVIIVATFGIAGFLTVYIFPKILPVFKSLNVKLPFATELLIAISGFLIQYGTFVLLGIIAFIVFMWLILKIKTVRFLLARLIISLPLVGKISRNYNVASFCRTLGLLLKSDIKVVEAVSITADTINNLIYKKELKHISANITKGEEISKNLKEKPNLFPLMLSQMIAIGENTGNLDETLLYLSDFYEKEIEELTKNLSTVLEPALMVLMGIIVGFIAVSIITPIYEVTQGLKK
ncbi:hypothetical protein COS61_00970 [Candidatus Wolfebacteria bacterium CG03_land_8_20_14_0_80_40_12]|uniref:Type II secretion system protein GspF domain-containing protein n=1 Tax=Candidatus Wolfebacteria bacterium CG03_land_8_20_14_0_80_40_12 TaxID=1975069 RepID=A0A2M7B660_9BACT|nr:MAG: hypothetical protein COS61_00970 [Candidatus Wolfebacteria bacterium CG03_land_8_20_14_0_80_40_12]